MNTFILPLLMAAPGANGEPGDALPSLIMFAAIILIFYFLIIRPQSKKRKDTEKMIAALKKGDRIVTIGGLYGTIQSIKDTTVIIKADDNVKLEFLRSAVSSVITQAKEEKEEIQASEQSSESGE
jgi:preprotein translocase subunit YajC